MVVERREFFLCGVATIMVEGENCEFSCFLLLCWTYYLIYTLDTQVETVFFIMSSFTKERFRKIYQLSVVFCYRTRKNAY